MNETTFKKYLSAAMADKGLNPKFSMGYQIGIRRHYHGSDFGVPDRLPDADDARGDGYRLGVAGEPYPTLHGLAGKPSNARIGAEPTDTTVQFRVTSLEKSGYVKQAQSEGKRLSEWIRKTLNAASEKYQD